MFPVVSTVCVGGQGGKGGMPGQRAFLGMVAATLSQEIGTLAHIIGVCMPNAGVATGLALGTSCCTAGLSF